MQEEYIRYWENGLSEATFTAVMPHNTSSTDSDPPYPPLLTADQRASKEEAQLLARHEIAGKYTKKDTKDPSKKQASKKKKPDDITMLDYISAAVPFGSLLCSFACFGREQMSVITRLHTHLRPDSPNGAGSLSSHSNYTGRLRHLSSEWKCLSQVSRFRRDELHILWAIWFFSLHMHRPQTTKSRTLLGSTTV